MSNRVKFLLEKWGRRKARDYSRGVGYASKSPLASFGVPRCGGVYDSSEPLGVDNELLELDAAIKELTIKERTLINCLYCLQLSRSAIAAQIACHINTVDNLHKSTLKKLDEMLNCVDKSVIVA